MKVSVLMTVYNAADFLPGALQSVLSQTHEDWELFVSDDNSPDPRVKVILKRLHDPRVRVRFLDTTDAARKESVRYATLLNDAASWATGQALTFLCGDDFFYPKRLERMVAKMEEGHPVVYGTQRMCHENGVDFGLRRADSILDDAFERVDLNSVMVRRSTFIAMGRFPTDPSLWRNADAHLWRKFTDAGYKFFPVDDPDDPTDCKRYRHDSVDARCIRGETPW